MEKRNRTKTKRCRNKKRRDRKTRSRKGSTIKMKGGSFSLAARYVIPLNNYDKVDVQREMVNARNVNV